MDAIVTRFFSDVSNVCGHEKTLHANFMHQLLMAGVPHASVAREYPIEGMRIDLALRAECREERWIACEDVRVAFEFKGGAYNARNALRDTIDANGYCKDMDRLAVLRKRGVECWFVCTDMTELGLALSNHARARVIAHCARRGIHFAYHEQGQPHCLIARAGRALVQIALAPRLAMTTPGARWQDGLTQLPLLLRQVDFTEDTATGLLYHALQRAGVGPERVSLETYFACAKDRSRMHERPDLCVFGQRVDGRFNLYRKGDRSRSNDGIKIGDLQAVIEVKGSDATRRRSERYFAAQIADDIVKLAHWRRRFAQSGYLPVDAERQPDYVMIAIDNRKSALTPAALADLRCQARTHAVDLHYLNIVDHEKA